MATMLIKSYLQNISNDLIEEDSEQGIEYIPYYVFNRFINLPMPITSKLYKFLSKSQLYPLTPEQFVTGMYKLLTADEETKLLTIFHLMDFTGDERVREKDLKIFQSLVIGSDKETSNCFSDKPYLSLEDIPKTGDLLENIYNKMLEGVSCKQDSIDFFILKYSPFHPSSSDTYEKKRLSSASDSTSDDEKLLSELISCTVDIKMPTTMKINNKFTNEKSQVEKPFYSLSDNFVSMKLKQSEIQEKVYNVKIDFEGYVFKQKNNGSLKKFWLVLVGKDIYYFKSQNKDDYRGIHNLSNSYISEAEPARLEDKDTYKFSIFLKKDREFLCRKKEEATAWVYHLKKAIEQRRIYTDYDILHLLGEGGFGKVKMARHKVTGNTYAVKIIDKNKLNKIDLERAILEKDILKQCKHRNIVTFIDSYEDTNNIYIVLEYLQYDLISYLEGGNVVLNSYRVKNILKQIVEGVRYLHDNGIVHRDLKLDNIMLKETTNGVIVKITDFGLSDVISTSTCLDQCGTIVYIAPEMILKQEYSYKIDVWSIGVILYYLLFSKLPWTGMDDNDIANNIIYNDLVIPEGTEYEKEIIELLIMCLQKDQEKRISVEDLLRHPWM
jgi:tRNA A-37 threonylcarbamoyl transferase component Bud32